jgi:hypothetical protein
VLGILTGHIYYFFTEIWPKFGGKQYLKPPGMFLKLLGSKPSSNLPNMPKKTAAESRSTVGNKKKILSFFSKQGKGKKLN